MEVTKRTVMQFIVCTACVMGLIAMMFFYAADANAAEKKPAKPKTVLLLTAKETGKSLTLTPSIEAGKNTKTIEYEILAPGCKTKSKQKIKKKEPVDDAWGTLFLPNVSYPKQNSKYTVELKARGINGNQKSIWVRSRKITIPAAKWTLRQDDVSVTAIGAHDATIKFPKDNKATDYRIKYKKANADGYKTTCNSTDKKYGIPNYAKKSGKAKFYTGNQNYLKAKTDYRAKVQAKINGTWVTATDKEGNIVEKLFTTKEEPKGTIGGEALSDCYWF